MNKKCNLYFKKFSDLTNRQSQYFSSYSKYLPATPTAPHRNPLNSSSFELLKIVLPSKISNPVDQCKLRDFCFTSPNQLNYSPIAILLPHPINSIHHTFTPPNQLNSPIAILNCTKRSHHHLVDFSVMISTSNRGFKLPMVN